MKRIIFLTLILSTLIYAQPRSYFSKQNLTKSSSIKLGNFGPSATESGFIIGYESGKFIDRNFVIGWSVDWFNKNYVDQILVQELNDYYGFFDSELNEVRAKTNLHSIPVLFNMTAKFPMAPRFSSYVTGGVGVEALLIFYRNYENPNEDEFEGAFDFNWRLGFGVAYQLGRHSDFVAEITYHSSHPSWTYEIDDPHVGRKQILEREFDMSGVMARIGFKFYY
ncbi:MAG: outer membrane beta-barrel protein [Ignavibacteriae bacterium]|nr:outer membrane beta-barrel protein [Ignavibacteriota bacterium]